MRILLISFLLAGCGTQNEKEAVTKPVPEKASEEEPEVSLDPPADVAAPPADATKTESGLAYKVIRPGKGKAKPTAQARSKFTTPAGKQTAPCSTALTSARRPRNSRSIE